MYKFAFCFGFLHTVFEVLVSADYIEYLSGFNYFLCILFEGLGYSLHEKNELGLLTYPAGTFLGEILRTIIQFLQYPLHIGPVLSVMGLIQVWNLLWWQAVGIVFIIPIISVCFVCFAYIYYVVCEK